MGHSPADVWGYTPKRLAGFLQLGFMRRKREAAEQLSINTLASRGEPKELEKQHRELANGWQGA